MLKGLRFETRISKQALQCTERGCVDADVMQMCFWACTAQPHWYIKPPDMQQPAINLK